MSAPTNEELALAVAKMACMVGWLLAVLDEGYDATGEDKPRCREFKQELDKMVSELVLDR